MVLVVTVIVLVYQLQREIEFDERYDGNPLVNAMCVGVIDHDMVQKVLLKVKEIQSFM